MRPGGAGDIDSLRRAAAAVGADPAAVVAIGHPSEATNNPRLVEVVQVGESMAEVPVGELSPVAGDGSYRFVVAACDLAKECAIDGIVTAPLNKAAMHAGGHKYPGHTELLAEQFGVENFSLVLSADALNPQAVRGKWELVVVCYHDQGHGPFKAVYGDDGVNITVGLPVVRVSVDHGTAFDIAGQGIAREASLVLATRRAAAPATGWDAVWETASRLRV